MTVIENTVQIDRAPEDVFDYLVDLRNELEWNPGTESMEKLTDGEMGVGTRFLAKWKQSKHIEVECTEYERPRRWTYVNGGPVSVTLTIELTAHGTGTQLHSSFDAQPNGWFRLVFPIFIRMMRRHERQNMANLKAALEQPARQPDATEDDQRPPVGGSAPYA